MIRIKYRLLSLVLAAVMIMGCLAYSAYDVVAESQETSAVEFWNETILDNTAENTVSDSYDSVNTLLQALDTAYAVNEVYLDTLLTAGEAYSKLKVSEKSKISADRVRLLEKEYIRASEQVVEQVNSLPSTGEIYLFSDNNEATMEKVLKLTYYSTRFPYNIQTTLPIEKLNQLENKLTRVLYADSEVIDKAKGIEEFTEEQGSSEALKVLETYQSLGDNTDLINTKSVEKLSSVVGNMVYSDNELKVKNDNFCLTITPEELSKDTAPTINISSEKLDLTKKQTNLYKAALKPKTQLSSINKLNVTVSGEKLETLAAPIAVTIPISLEIAESNPYVIVYDGQNSTNLYDTDNDKNTITVMMSKITEYAVAYDASSSTSSEVTNNIVNQVTSSSQQSGVGYSGGTSTNNKPSSNSSISNTSSSNQTVSSASSKEDNKQVSASLSSSEKAESTVSSSVSSNTSSDTTSSDSVSSSITSSSSASSKKNVASSGADQNGEISSNDASGKPTLENMPTEIKHNNRSVLIFVLIGAIVLLVGILVIMFMPKNGKNKKD